MMLGVAFAGVTGAGKSTLFDLLSRRFSVRKAFVFTNDIVQKPGFKLQNSSKNYISAELSSFLNATTQIHVKLAGLSRLLVPPAQMPPVISESWCLNLLAELEIWDRPAFDTLDAYRSNAGLCIVHLSYRVEELHHRAVISTRQYRSPAWGRYLDSLGGGVEAQSNIFLRRREMIARYFAICREPKMEVDTSDMRWADIADKLHGVLRL